MESVAAARPNQPIPIRVHARRRRVVQTLIAFVVLFGVLAALAVGYAWKTFNKIERVPVASVLTPETGGDINYLIVGTDSRDLRHWIDRPHFVVAGHRRFVGPCMGDQSEPCDGRTRDGGIGIHGNLVDGRWY